MIGLDTNILVRFFTSDDVAMTARSRQILEEAEDRGETLCVNAIVLCELLWTLKSSPYRFSREALARVVESILETPLFLVPFHTEVGRALRRFETGKADFADYLIGELNSKTGCGVTLTFDRRLASAPAFGSAYAED
jgi:predicted nucleic-acid-binding protein